MLRTQLACFSFFLAFAQIAFADPSSSKDSSASISSSQESGCDDTVAAPVANTTLPDNTHLSNTGAKTLPDAINTASPE